MDVNNANSSGVPDATGLTEAPAYTANSQKMIRGERDNELLNFAKWAKEDYPDYEMTESADEKFETDIWMGCAKPKNERIEHLSKENDELRKQLYKLQDWFVKSEYKNHDELALMSISEAVICIMNSLSWTKNINNSLIALAIKYPVAPLELVKIWDKYKDQIKNLKTLESMVASTYCNGINLLEMLDEISEAR